MVIGANMSANNKQIDTVEFIRRAQTAHGDRYDYSQTIYRNVRTSVTVICRIHGPWQATPKAHYGVGGKSGSVCPECDRLKRYKNGAETLQLLQKLHPKLDFSESTYFGANKHITAKCPQHGLIKMLVSNLMIGATCRLCSYAARPGGYSEELFNRRPDLKDVWGQFYIVEFKNEIERFLKIGITRVGTKDRFAHKQGFEIKPLHTQEDTLYKCFCLEQRIISDFSHFRYFPKFGRWSQENGRSRHSIHGWTECFKPELLTAEPAIRGYGLNQEGIGDELVQHQ